MKRSNSLSQLEILHAQIEFVRKGIERVHPNFNEFQLWKALIADLQFYARCGWLRLGSQPIIAVTGIVTDEFFIVYLYWEIERDDDDGLFGYGYAYNMTDPVLSEAGYLFTPSRKWLEKNADLREAWN
jgi:hypothetical protein